MLLKEKKMNQIVIKRTVRERQLLLFRRDARGACAFKSRGNRCCCFRAAAAHAASRLALFCLSLCPMRVCRVCGMRRAGGAFSLGRCNAVVSRKVLPFDGLIHS